MASDLVLWCWIFLFHFKGTPSWILQKTFSPLELKLFVMWETISEVLQVVYEVLNTLNANGTWC
jgi:hypothetical protein